ncbi:hypothetical protein V9L05_18330 [Bernardetia sp. Wsw4-3y2]|uniref:hypothetical protein n=1 Tax=Bernardetia sp. Wsw4-3y2 TaxID=3127471 RepID=UPI0030CDBE41
MNSQPTDPTKRKSLLFDDEPATDYGNSKPVSSTFTMTDSEAVVFRHKTFGSEKYTSSQATYVYVNGRKLVNFSQKQEFTLSLTQAGTTPIFELDILKDDMDDGMNLKEQMNGLLEKIVSLKSNLHLALTGHGKILNVVNKAAIQKKWFALKEEMKEDENIKSLPENLRKQTFTKGDVEFSPDYPLQNELNKQLFYFGLFFPLYGRAFTDKSVTITDLSIVSTLFGELSIPLRISMDLMYDEETEEYAIRLDGNVDKGRLSRRVVEESYKKNYPFVKDSFSKYTCHIQALYIIDKNTHQIEEVEMEIEEKVNDNLIAIQELDIERFLEEEEEEELTNV